MKSKLATIFLLIFLIVTWWYLSSFVWENYQDLINQKSVVTLSILTLWFPVGIWGGVASFTIMASKSIYTGKAMNQCLSPKAYQLSNKVVKYFAILGIFTAIGFAWHSFNLLDEYGYQYNSKLTKITPTGIHLVYTKP